MKAVIFRAKIDGDVRNACFKVLLTDALIDSLLVLIMAKNKKGHRKCLVATCSKEEVEIPINLFSSIHSYCFEIYGLKKNGSKTEMYYDCVGYTRRRLTVNRGDGKSDVHFVLKLEDQNACFPLSCVAQNLYINVSHQPVSVYTVKGSSAFHNNKTFITILKQPESGFKLFVHKDNKLKYRIPFDLPACKKYDVKVVVGFVIFENADVSILRIESHSKVVTFKACKYIKK